MNNSSSSFTPAPSVHIQTNPDPVRSTSTPVSLAQSPTLTATPQASTGQHATAQTSTVHVHKEHLLTWCRQHSQTREGFFFLLGQGRALFFFDFAQQWMQKLTERPLPNEFSVKQERQGCDGLRHHPTSQHLAKWIWDMSQNESWGQHLPWTYKDIISLHQWPPFHVLSHRHDHFLLASYLMKRPSSMEDACRMLRLPLDDGMNFLRGIYGMGLAERSQPPPKTQSPTSRLMKWWQGRKEEIQPNTQSSSGPMSPSPRVSSLSEQGKS